MFLCNIIFYLIFMNQFSYNYLQVEHIRILATILPSVSVSVKSGLLLKCVDSCFQQYFTLLISSMNSESKEVTKNDSIDVSDYKVSLELLKAMCLCIQNEVVHENVKILFFIHVKNLWDALNCDNLVRYHIYIHYKQ